MLDFTNFLQLPLLAPQTSLHIISSTMWWKSNQTCVKGYSSIRLHKIFTLNKKYNMYSVCTISWNSHLNILFLNQDAGTGYGVIEWFTNFWLTYCFPYSSKLITILDDRLPWMTSWCSRCSVARCLNSQIITKLENCTYIYIFVVQNAAMMRCR